MEILFFENYVIAGKNLWIVYELKARLLQIRKIWGIEIAVLNEELAKEYKIIC